MNFRPHRRVFLSRAVCILFLVTLPVSGEVTPAALFGSRMVLQRDRPIPAWGRANPGEHVTITLGGQTVSTTSDNDGRWLARLALLPASRNLEMKISVPGGAALTLTDVAVGDGRK